MESIEPNVAAEDRIQGDADEQCQEGHGKEIRELREDCKEMEGEAAGIWRRVVEDIP